MSIKLFTPSSETFFNGQKVIMEQLMIYIGAKDQNKWRKQN
jgi:hypothetical protein